jgi:hypothetical protein
MLAIGLAACADDPDSEITLWTPSKSHSAYLATYSPGLTIDPWFILQFDQNKKQRQTATFTVISNGTVGWVSDNQLLIVADKLKYRTIAREYFPVNDYKKRVILSVCVRSEVDCSRIESQMIKGSTKPIPDFP